MHSVFRKVVYMSVCIMSASFGRSLHTCYVCSSARAANDKEKVIRCIGSDHACHAESLVETYNDYEGGQSHLIDLLDDDVRAALEQVERWPAVFQSGGCDAHEGDRFFHSSCVGREPSLGNINTLVNFSKDRKHAELRHLHKLCPECHQKCSERRLPAGVLGRWLLLAASMLTVGTMLLKRQRSHSWSW